MRPSSLEYLLKSKNSTEREQCILLLQEYLKKSPEDVQSWYDLASCFDFLGREVEALAPYKKVLQLGTEKLSSTDQKGFFVGYGSTLRNNDKLVESEKVLRQGISLFPEYGPLKVFLGLSLYSSQKYSEASIALLEATALASDSMDGYTPVIREYLKIIERARA